MKTSTKLIIIFFMCIPTSLLAYNFILKAEYEKGNVVRNLYPKNNSNYISKTGLGKFTHVVINGSLKLNNGAFETWLAHVWIGGSNSTLNNDNRVGVLERLKDNFSATVKNDTLFIMFHVTGEFDDTATDWNLENNIVKIYSNEVKSVTVSDAKVTISSNPGINDSLKLVAGNQSSYDVQNLRLQKLAVIAKDSSSLNIRQSNKIGMLCYSLQDKSLLNVEESPAQHYLAGRIDRDAKIQLSGKASVLQKQLH